MDVEATLAAMAVLKDAGLHLAEDSVAYRWLSRARLHLADSLNDYLRGGK